MTTSTPATTILAVDLGKYKSVACVYQGGPVEARFDSQSSQRQSRGKAPGRKALGADVVRLRRLDRSPTTSTTA
jgi:hypothetical protein